MESERGFQACESLSVRAGGRLPFSSSRFAPPLILRRATPSDGRAAAAAPATTQHNHEQPVQLLINGRVHCSDKCLGFVEKCFVLSGLLRWLTSSFTSSPPSLQAEFRAVIASFRNCSFRPQRFSITFSFSVGSLFRRVRRAPRSRRIWSPATPMRSRPSWKNKQPWRAVRDG